MWVCAHLSAVTMVIMFSDRSISEREHETTFDVQRFHSEFNSNRFKTSLLFPICFSHQLSFLRQVCVIKNFFLSDRFIFWFSGLRTNISSLSKQCCFRSLHCDWTLIWEATLTDICYLKTNFLVNKLNLLFCPDSGGGRFSLTLISDPFLKQ